MRRARQVLRSHDYIDAFDTAAEELEKLSILEGQPISSGHKVDLYLSYLREKQVGLSLSADTLNQHHPFYRSVRPRTMTLVRDTLESINN